MVQPTCITHIYDQPDMLDRYTLYLDWQATPPYAACLCLSDNPTRPNGFSQFSTGMVGKHNGKKILWSELPDNVQRHAIDRLSPVE